MSSNEYSLSVNNLYTGSIITSIVGAILLLFTGFAGWDGSNYYLGIYVTGYVGPDLENPLSIVPFLVTALLLLFTAYISVLVIQGKEFDPKLREYAYYTALIAFLIVAIGGLLFIVSMFVDEPEDWWLDTGFFGGILGSGLTVALLYMARKQQ